MAKNKNKNTGTPREYTMPNNYQQGGYAKYNQAADRMTNAELIGNDITSLKAKREQIQKELDELKIKRQNFDLLSVNVPEQTDEDKENIQAGQFRAGAEAMMEYDPATAQSWLLRADEIEARKQNRIREQTPEAARHQLRIARDSAMKIVSSDSDQVSSADRELAKKIALIYTTEMSKPNPSTQFAEIKIDELYKSQLTPNGGGGGTTYNDLSTEISTTIGGIKFKGKALDDANLALLKKINDSKLSQTDIDRLKSELNLAISTKGDAPKVTDYEAKALGALDKLPATTMGSKISGMNNARDLLQSASEAASNYKNAKTQAMKDQSANAMLTILGRLVAGGVLSDGEYDTAKATEGVDAAVQTLKDKIGFVGKNVTDDQAKAVLERLNTRIKNFNAGRLALITKLLDFVDPKKEARTEVVNTKVKAMVPDPVNAVLTLSGSSSNAPVVVPIPPPSDNIPPGTKEGGTWDDKYYDYRLKNGKPQSKRKKG